MFKNQRVKFIFFIAFIYAVCGCNPESKPIHYGEDKCEFCRMSIVDQRFGGEVVTQKGKTYKFDAVECLVNYLDERVEDETKLKFILTNTYDNPGGLVDVSACTYLKSANMPSPMGMFINPFKERSEAVILQEENAGTLFSWEELRADFVANK